MKKVDFFDENKYSHNQTAPVEVESPLSVDFNVEQKNILMPSQLQKESFDITFNSHHNPTILTTQLDHSRRASISASIVLAAVYVCIAVSYSLVIRHSQSNYDFDSAPLIFLTELSKMGICIMLKYCADGDFIPHGILFSNDRVEIWKKGLPYAVPALLYAIYNNMTFFNLDIFDPGTYQMLMQTRILFTGFIFTLMFKKALSIRKWVGLTLLAFAVASKYFLRTSVLLDHYAFFAFFQAFLSSLAAVYNEYMFKSDAKLSIHTQNFFMYFYGVLFNGLFGVLLLPKFTSQSSDMIENSRLMLVIVLLGAMLGITTSFVLKFIDVMVKQFASGIEVPLVVCGAAILLEEEVFTIQDFLIGVIIMFSVYVFYSEGWGSSRFVHFNFRN